MTNEQLSSRNSTSNLSTSSDRRSVPNALQSDRRPREDGSSHEPISVGNTGRVFRTVATPTGEHYRRQVYLLRKTSDFDFHLIPHNHPPGDPAPSPEDIDLTRRLAAAGVLMGIDEIDHVVLGDVRDWSFKEAGRL
jgi:hypothetical protein